MIILSASSPPSTPNPQDPLKIFFSLMISTFSGFPRVSRVFFMINRNVCTFIFEEYMCLLRDVCRPLNLVMTWAHYPSDVKKKKRKEFLCLWLYFLKTIYLLKIISFIMVFSYIDTWCLDHIYSNEPLLYSPTIFYIF